MNPLDGPLLEWLGDVDPDNQDTLASNDEWAFKKADSLVSRIPRHVGKDRKTEGEVFDRITLMALHKLLATGVLRSLDFPISTGKEANVFRGTTPRMDHVAVKIYRVNTATFKHVMGYIQGDERFEGVTGDKRAMVEAWAQKEFRNLIRMRDAGIDVPEPLRVIRNVLVTEYIGTPDGPWPKLKDFNFVSDSEAQAFFEKLSTDYVNMVHEAELVHGDLSEYNILVQDSDDSTKMRPRIIDVGQAVLRNHPMSLEYLERDIKNLTNYFKRKGARAEPDALLNRIKAGLK